MGVALFIVYAMGILASGAISCRKANSREGFSINNRNSSAWLVGFSIVVSCVGASATMGTVGLAFSVGTPAFWWLGSGALGLSVLTISLARKIRRSHAIPLSEMVQDFFGSQARWIISLIIVVAWLAILAAQFTALKQIIAVLTGSSQASACMLGAGLIAAHTLLGGQAGIIKLDKWQGVILLFGLLLVISWLLGINGGALSEVRFEIVNREFSADRLIYFLLILGGSYVVCPMLFGRLLSARSEQAAQKGALGAVLALFLVSAMVVMIGLLSKGLIPAHTVPDQVLSTVLEQVFPWWLTDWRQLPLICNLIQVGGYIWRGIIAWNKGPAARAPHKGYFRHQCEYIVWGTKEKALKITHDGPLSGCINVPVSGVEPLNCSDKRAIPQSQISERRGLFAAPFALVVHNFKKLFNTGRDERIRTSGPLLPRQVRYQAAPRPAYIHALLITFYEPIKQEAKLVFR